MKFQTFYLKFTAPLHLGNYKPEGYDKSEIFLRSDTIVAAIKHSWALTGQEYLIEKYINNISFNVSSAFPFLKNKTGEIVHFFPRPKLRWNYDYNPDLSKKIKKIAWVDKDYFEKIINYSKLDKDKSKFENALQGEFFTAVDLPRDIYSKEVQERVKIPRNFDGDSTPFYMERIRFNSMSGLYFLATGDDDMVELISGLEILQNEGFGTDRNVGNGYFEYSQGEIDISVPGNANKITNLGLYCPEDRNQLESFLDNQSSFSIIKRGGWITKPEFQGYRKKNIYMFEEGSVFSGDKTLAGKANIDLTPGIIENEKMHIYRNGKTIFIPVNLIDNEK